MIEALLLLLKEGHRGKRQPRAAELYPPLGAANLAIPIVQTSQHERLGAMCCSAVIIERAP